MGTLYRLFTVLMLVIIAWSAPSPSCAVELPRAPYWQLIWSDEFEGKVIDRSKWDFDLGNGFYAYDTKQWVNGWGNNELQYYTNAPENAFIKDGMLHLRVMKESFMGCGYTSARLKTRDRFGNSLFSKTYGRYEFRAKLPASKGIWPAIWMLPQNDSYGVWAASGEIDIVEVDGQTPNQLRNTIHFGSRWPVNAFVRKDYNLPVNQRVTDFHVYALEWEPGEIRSYIDGQLLATHNFWWSSSKKVDVRGVLPSNENELNRWPAPFDQAFYIIMNIAVEGRFPNDPDETTVLPADMVVDYVRVYDKVGGYDQLMPRGEGALPFSMKK